jgi:hypothetical protein
LQRSISFSKPTGCQITDYERVLQRNPANKEEPVAVCLVDASGRHLLMPTIEQKSEAYLNLTALVKLKPDDLTDEF